eukprot:gene11181-23360_t
MNLNFPNISLNDSRSISDSKDYCVIVLSNGLEVLLVSSLEHQHNMMSSVHATNDSNSASGSTKLPAEIQSPAKAAAGLCVSAGSFADPSYAEGLAHFVEHMVFMGSAKYPDENEYESFISSHGGECNACTEGEFTSYYFDVLSEYFLPALDIFAQCFISPKLLLDSADRELQAIENEFRMASTEDSVRRQQLFCHCCNPNHVLNKFSWGNMKSLKTIPQQNKVDMSQMLRSFYETHYQPQNMKLVVMAPKSLIELYEDVIACFSSFIPLSSSSSSISSSPTVKLPAMHDTLLGQSLPILISSERSYYRIVPLKKNHKLCLSWLLPPCLQNYRKKVEEYLAFLIGHEGPGSLLSALKSDGFATGLSAGTSDSNIEVNSMFTQFSVSVTLTKKGLMNWISVVDKIYQYISMLKSDGIQDWVYEEIKQMSAVSYAYMDEEEESELVQR